jgi:CP family cyanate transporter-like MFS transporter
MSFGVRFMSLSSRAVAPVSLIVGILVIAASLRAPFTSVAPLLNMIRDSFDLGTAAAGALTTLPLLAFAVISPFAARIARLWGMERTLMAALVLVGCGVVLRSAGNVWCLYLGTTIIGGGIALGNVLLPGLLKRDFPGRIAALTAAYVVTMGVTSATGSAIVVPLAHLPGSGWPLVLGAFVVLPLLAAGLWLPQLRRHSVPAGDPAAAAPGGNVWRAPLAWQVTLFFGLNSFVYYITVAWWPAMLQDAGYTAAGAGSQHAVLQLATVLPGLLLVPIVNRMKDQRAIAAASSLLAVIGFAGFVVVPAWATLWSILIGIGTGAVLILALAFVSMRAATPSQAAALSGMAQCVGYLLAASGPTLAGIVHDGAGGWALPLLACAVLCAVMAVLGLLAGRAVHIADAPRV